MRKNEPLIDRPPELFAFKDTGCDLHPACLTCPLPRCRYDEPGWRQREERGQRDTEVLRLRMRQALSVGDLAAQFGVSTRTVHRILRAGDRRVKTLSRAA